MAQVGKVIQIAGPAVDIQFESGHLPKIYNAIRITSEGFDVPEPINVICEVQQHLGEGRVRTVAMLATDGMVRGMPAVDTGACTVTTMSAGRTVTKPFDMARRLLFTLTGTIGSWCSIASRKSRERNAVEIMYGRG